MNSNIPPLIEQYKENMLDKRQSEAVRFNYSISLRNIRDFCEAALSEYNATQSKK